MYFIRSNRFFYFINFIILIFLCTGCKSSKKSVASKPEPIRNFDAPSVQLEQLRDGRNPNFKNEKRSEKKSIRTLTLDQFDLRTPTATLSQVAHIPLSHFSSDSTSYRVRVSFQLKGMPKSQADAYEERLFALLNERAPQPWTLLRARQFDKNETADARLTVSFKRQILRQKRSGKLSPTRMLVQYDVDFNFFGLPQKTASWNGWKYAWQEEALNLSETAIADRFWRDFEKSVPLLTAIDAEQTAQWLKSQGLSPQIMTGNVDAISAENHTYYPDGCLFSREDSPDSAHEIWIRSLLSPLSPPQKLALENVEDARCTRDGLFTLSYDTPLQMHLFYQPFASQNAWKTTLAFSHPITPQTIQLHVDDDLICAFPRNTATQIRAVEITCIDRKTGLPRWKTAPIPGSFNGFAYDDSKLVFATDQVVLAIARHGDILNLQKIETRGRLRSRDFCQMGKHLVFTTAPGEFAAYNMDTQSFDWQYRALDPKFIHCSKPNTFIVSESGGYLLALDIENHKPKWKFRSLALPIAAMTHRNIVYFLFERAILGLDADSGMQVAQIPLPWRALNFIQIGSKNFIDTGNTIYRF